VSRDPSVQKQLSSRAFFSALGLALKDAALAALVAFGLFSLLIGIRTDQGPTGGLIVYTRFDSLAALVIAVFVGAFLRALFFGEASIVPFCSRLFTSLVPPRLAGWQQSAVAARIKRIVQFIRQWISLVVGTALLAFTFAVPVIFYDNRYILDLGILMLTYVMLGWGLNIVVGLAGLLDLGYVAFYAVGAYSYALLAQNFGVSFWIGLPLAKRRKAKACAGSHIAFVAANRKAVDAFYKAALKAGGKDNGKPGLRPEYHANYYGAFVFDPEGHAIEACCHNPE